jgi:hypothetical protein
MDFTVDYFFMRNGNVYANITRNGRIYERLCRIGSDNSPVFKFLGRWWYYSDRSLQFSYDD